MVLWLWSQNHQPTIVLSPLAVDWYLRVCLIRWTIFLARSFFSRRQRAEGRSRERVATLQLLNIANDNLNAKHAFAFDVNL
jgi:hypothetical protein